MRSERSSRTQNGIAADSPSRRSEPAHVRPVLKAKPTRPCHAVDCHAALMVRKGKIFRGRGTIKRGVFIETQSGMLYGTLALVAQRRPRRLPLCSQVPVQPIMMETAACQTLSLQRSTAYCAHVSSNGCSYGFDSKKRIVTSNPAKYVAPEHGTSGVRHMAADRVAIVTGA